MERFRQIFLVLLRRHVWNLHYCGFASLYSRHIGVREHLFGFDLDWTLWRSWRRNWWREVYQDTYHSYKYGHREQFDWKVDLQQDFHVYQSQHAQEDGLGAISSQDFALRREHYRFDNEQVPNWRWNSRQLPFPIPRANGLRLQIASFLCNCVLFVPSADCIGCIANDLSVHVETQDYLCGQWCHSPEIFIANPD